MDKRDSQSLMRRSEQMSDRRYILNRKCFAALKAIGPGAENRWKYIHVSPKGVTCTDTVSLVRVTLPVIAGKPSSGASHNTDPVIYDLDTAKKLCPKGDETI